MDVALGGTFDPVHDGHRELFKRAFGLGDVTVGLTTDELATETRHVDRFVSQFDLRRERLAAVLSELADQFGREFEIRPLREPTGIAVESSFEHLVVSPETKIGGDRINKLRLERGLKPLQVHIVPHLRAEDGDIISSTRIVRGEIDVHGAPTPGREPGHPHT